MVKAQKEQLIAEAQRVYGERLKGLTDDKKQEYLVAIEEEAMKRVEMMLKNVRDSLPPAAAPSAPDTDGSPLPTHRPAALKLNPQTGRYERRDMADASGAASPQEPSPVPSEPVQPATGSMVGVTGAEDKPGAGGPISPDDFRQRMRDRARERGMIV